MEPERSRLTPRPPSSVGLQTRWGRQGLGRLVPLGLAGGAGKKEEGSGSQAGTMLARSQELESGLRRGGREKDQGGEEKRWRKCAHGECPAPLAVPEPA